MLAVHPRMSKDVNKVHPMLPNLHEWPISLEAAAGIRSSPTRRSANAKDAETKHSCIFQLKNTLKNQLKTEKRGFKTDSLHKFLAALLSCLNFVQIFSAFRTLP